jgi:hypothetical protein
MARDIDLKIKSATDSIGSKFGEVESSVRNSNANGDAARLGLKKIQGQLNQRFDQVKADQSELAMQLGEFQLVTKDSLGTLEENLIKYNK